jgi:hypothetical protein
MERARSDLTLMDLNGILNDSCGDMLKRSDSGS